MVGFAKSGPRNNLTRILENPTRSLYSKNESKQFLYKANDIPGTHHRNTKKYPGLDEFPLGQELKTQVHKVELFFKMNGTKQNNREIKKQAACSMTAPCFA